MKKLVFLACFMAVSSFMACTACGSQTASEQNANDSDSIAVVDSLVPDSAVAE